MITYPIWITVISLAGFKEWAVAMAEIRIAKAEGKA